MIGKPLNNTDDDEGRDWLFLETGAAQRNDMAEIGDDIGTLHHFLRGKPLATSEVRDAIVRILHSGWDTMGVGKNLISILFTGQWPKPDKDERPTWTVDFKRTSKGQPNPWRDTQIAIAIQACRDCGKSYDEAIEWAVENFGIGERRAKQIYGKSKDKITKLRFRSVKSDR
jgi:hypothetical protein